MIDLISDKRIDDILLKNYQSLKEKVKVEYNLFTLSSYNNQLENFHSDVIGSFLNPKGMHGEGKLFLIEFIKYLNSHHAFKIDFNDFQAPIVKREQGRLDILIYDEKEDTAIIFENKINDAPDAKEQLIRYYSWCENNKLHTKAILYVSLRGLKKAPPVKPEMNSLLRNIAIFSNEDLDLVNGWLLPCIEKCNSIETKSLLIQYVKLIKHLAFDSMEKITMDEFYDIANEKGFLAKVKDLNKLTSKIPIYRTDNFQNSIEDYRPFKKSHRFKPNYMLFQDYWEGDDNFKLDISFENDGSAWIQLWNTGQRDEKGNESLLKKVMQISYLDKLETDEANSWFKKRFNLEEYKTMAEMDKKIIQFTRELMDELNQNIKNE